MEIEKDYSISPYDMYCLEHCGKAEFLLKINGGGVMVPLCQECVDELYQELGKVASK